MSSSSPSLPLPISGGNGRDTAGQLAGKKRPAPRGTAAYPRKRAVKACQVCRARRTKCDNRKPSCSFCLKVGAQCIQSPSDLSSFDPASLRILERLDEIEQAILSPRHTVNTALNDEQATIRAAPSRSPRLRESVPHTKILPQTVEEILDWPCLQQEPPMTSSSNIVNTTSRNSRSQYQTNSYTDVPMVLSPTAIPDELEPKTTKLFLDNFFTHFHVKNPILNESQTRHTVARLCLHGIDWTPSSCIALLVCALGAISAPLGDSSHVGRDTQAYATAQSFYTAAQKRLGPMLCSAGLVEAQCLFLAGAYMMCTLQRAKAWRLFLQALACCQEFGFLRRRWSGRSDPIGTGSERSGGSGVGETAEEEQADDDAQGLRPQQQEPNDSTSQAEQAVYWSAWKSERELRGDVQTRDFGLSEPEIAFYPTFFPTPPCPSAEFADNDDDTALGEEYRHRETLSWYFYLSEISLRRLATHVATDMVFFQPEEQPDEERSERAVLLDGLTVKIPEYEARVTEWITTLPDIVTLQTPREEDDVCKFVLRGHVINMYEMLYWPFVDAVINQVPNAADADADDGVGRSSSSTNNNTALIGLVTKGLQTHVDRIQVNIPGFRHRHHGTPCMLRSCGRSALVLLAAASKLQSSVDQGLLPLFEMPTDWKSAVAAIIEMNRYWAGESEDASFLLAELELIWSRLEGCDV